MCESVESRRNWVFFPKSESVPLWFHLPSPRVEMLLRTVPMYSSLRLANTEECSEYV